MNTKSLSISRFNLMISLAVCFLAAYFALPNILTEEQRQQLAEWLPERHLNLGLDLQGGSHLLLEVDADTYAKEQLLQLRSAVRQELRSKQIGYSELDTQGEAVTVTIRPETINEDINIPYLLRRAADGLEVTVAGDNRYTIEFTEQEKEARSRRLVSQTVEILSRRIDETGTREPIIQQQGDNRILLQVPGVSDPQQIKDILGTTAKMNFHLVDHRVTAEQLMRGDVPLGTDIFYSEARDGEPAMPYALIAEPALSGEALVDANPSSEQGQAVVSFRFDAAGARLFGEITQQNIGKQFAVVLDNKVITAPVIRTAILGGSGIIEGGFTPQTSENLALLLRAGALPTDVNIIEERSVGPSLGADSIAAGKLAAVLAVVLVIIFMIASYGLFGVFATIALLLNMVLLFGGLSLLQATLTLPGIAGIVLTLGMAVDANVLIFERIREEVARGRGVLTAIDKGFNGAFGTILDSNITTLIAAFVLFYFGSGTIKGFAVTLSFGILSSMFSAILLTRLMIIIWLKSSRRTSLPI